MSDPKESTNPIAERLDATCDGYQRALDFMSDEEAKSLALALLMKREVDGLNGRMWSATEHLKWEQRIRLLLRLEAFNK